jgi:hypothetical protein
MYSHQTVSQRFSNISSNYNNHFVVVQFNGGWQYYDGSWNPFTPCSSDFLVASFNTSSSVTPLTNSNRWEINGISEGYALSGSSSNFGFSSDSDGFSVSGSQVHPTWAMVNEVIRQYNDWGMFTAEYQSDAGPVNLSSMPVVQYGYTYTSNNI